MALELFVATLSAMVGAGFASGREIWVFFADRGPSAIWLGALASILLALAAWRTAQRTTRTADPLRALFGPYRQIAQIGISLFSLLTFAAVLAVLGSLSQSEWHVGHIPASLAAAALAAVMATAGPRRQFRLQGALLAAILVAGAAAAGLALARPPAHLPPLQVGWQTVVGVVGYVAYNIALATYGIARSAASGDRRGAFGAAFGGLIAGLLLTLEAAALARHGALVSQEDLPLVALAASIHSALGALLGVTVMLAGLSAAASFAAASGPWLGGAWPAAVVAFALSLLGVQGLIDRGYPMMAAVAGFWLVLLFWGPRLRRLGRFR